MIGAMKESISSAMNAATQHLYVYDGDLKNEDALGKEIAADIAAGDQNGPKLVALMQGTSAASAVAAEDAARERFHGALAKAIKLLAPGDGRRRRRARRLARLLPRDARPAVRRRLRGRRQGDRGGRRMSPTTTAAQADANAASAVRLIIDRSAPPRC